MTDKGLHGERPSRSGEGYQRTKGPHGTERQHLQNVERRQAFTGNTFRVDVHNTIRPPEIPSAGQRDGRHRLVKDRRMATIAYPGVTDSLWIFLHKFRVQVVTDIIVDVRRERGLVHLGQTIVVGQIFFV